MSESPLLLLPSGLKSLLNAMPAAPEIWMLAGAMALAFLFHRTQWLILLWLVLVVRLTEATPGQLWPSIALWLAWYQAVWLPSTPLRRPLSWLTLLGLTAVALSPLLPWSDAWLSTSVPGLTPLPGLEMAPLTLLLAFGMALSLLFRHFLSPTSNWFWHGLGLAFTFGLCLTDGNEPIFWQGLPLVVAAGMLSDAYSVAYRDALTGIPNRRALSQTMKTLGRRYAIAMADVDHFKSFNDTWGHETGDQVLKLVARLLHDSKLPVRVFRYGGEEFTLVFRGMTKEEAMPLLDELRERIANYPLTVRQPGRPKSRSRGKQRRGQQGGNTKSVRITTSFGVTDNHSAETPHAAMQLADKALYKAKQAGRNCVRG